MASTDGVGTKAEAGFSSGQARHHRHRPGGHVRQRSPLLRRAPGHFLDYYATGETGPRAVQENNRGILEGCRQGRSVLLGGETAEMPGFYKPGEYDLAGFSVGIADNKKLIDGSG